MPTVETNVRPTEQELVELWRATELERAGYRVTKTQHQFNKSLPARP